jgi:Flp pilus assembly protein TadG
VEFGLAALVFLMVLFGIMEIGRAIHAYHFVDTAARAATRYAIVRGSDSPSPASAADIQSFVKGLGFDPAALTVSTTWTPNNAPGSAVQVTVQYNFRRAVPFWPTATMVLTSSSQMVISQ